MKMYDTLVKEKGLDAFHDDLAFDRAILYMDKLDGSLISTVKDDSAQYGFRLKSKTSFSSSQAIDAYEFLLKDRELLDYVFHLVCIGHTVNFEWIGETNRIVLGYPGHSLKILNSRRLDNGQTFLPNIHAKLNENYRKHLVSHDTMQRSYEQIINMTGCEGFVVVWDDGTICKVKNNWYVKLHAVKSSINNPKALFQACLYETSDDLRSLFHDDELAMKQITAMETLVRHEYNHRSAQLQAFYEENKLLDRKSYAILGQSVLKEAGTFSLAMNLYLGKDMGLKDWMMKNYREFGINDVPVVESEN